MFPIDLIRKRILVFGANGMLGQRIVHYFSSDKDVQLLCCSFEKDPVYRNVDYSQCDITSRDHIKGTILDFYPDIIINAAAYTNVDLSEIEREQAWKVNVKGVEHMAEGARILDAHLIHFSSDYVFDGLKGPYSEKAAPNPLGYYGRTKLASENALKISGSMHTILRTNVVYGIANSRPDFVRWVINSLREHRQVRIVTDQVNNPTFIDDIVQAIMRVIEFRKEGLYNIGGRDFLSRYDFTMKIASFFELDKSLIFPITTAELNQKAKRPLQSGLITIKAESELGFKPHTIHEALSFMKKELSL